MIDTLRDEFDKEMRTTRRLIERIPEDRSGWRPHHKSYTAIELGAHIVDCIGWTPAIFGGDELDMNPASYTFCQPASVADLVEAFDDGVAKSTRAMAAAVDADLLKPWRLLIRGKLRFERPRDIVFRDLTVSHLIHHRGQLSVYLRLMDVPVPGSYGPTADDRA